MPKYYFIPFTQYRRPHGRKVDVRMSTTDRELDAKAKAIRASGFVFETELLQGDIVSLTITHPRHGDMSHRLVRNGRGVIPAVTEMIQSFNILRAQQRIKEQEDDERNNG